MNPGDLQELNSSRLSRKTDKRMYIFKMCSHWYHQICWFHRLWHKRWQGAKETLSFFFTYTEHTAEELGTESRSAFSPCRAMLLCFYKAFAMIYSGHFRNISVSSEAVGTHFIYSSDQKLDQTIHMSTGQRFDMSLLNWSLLWNEWHESWVNQSLLPWEALQWLKVGNVFPSPCYLGEFVILHGNCSMLKHASTALSLRADLHIFALTHNYILWCIHFIGFL